MKLLDFARLNKPAFVPDWYHELIAQHLDRLVAGDPDVPNLLISAPPGSGKTELVSIQFPACTLAHDPKLHVIALANSDQLARMAGGNVLRILRSPDVQECFPIQFAKEGEGSWTITDNDGRPSCHAAGIGGQLTGHRADFLIFDDLIKSQQEAYSETVRETVWANFSSAAETRLLPNGKIVGISTRWHLDDPIARLLRRAQENPRARQFIYISLAAINSGEDSFILDTRTGKKTYPPKYKALARKHSQPYSFTRSQLEGKKADLGPSRWAALYMQNPLTGEDQLFPPECWRSYERLNNDELELVVTAWDCASKIGSGNDYSANVVVGRLSSGGFAVLDVWKSKLTFAELPDVAAERYRMLMARYGTVPVLAVEDANAGTQLLQLFEYRWPHVPLVKAKPSGAKIIRAEGVTALTRGGLVMLPHDAEWKEQFISEMANFPVGIHDDIVDSFCYAMKVFVGAGDFRKPDFHGLLPGRAPDAYEERVAALMEEAEYREQTGISNELDEFDGPLFGLLPGSEREDW